MPPAKPTSLTTPSKKRRRGKSSSSSSKNKANPQPTPCSDEDVDSYIDPSPSSAPPAQLLPLTQPSSSSPSSNPCQEFSLPFDPDDSSESELERTSSESDEDQLPISELERTQMTPHDSKKRKLSLSLAQSDEEEEADGSTPSGKRRRVEPSESPESVAGRAQAALSAATEFLVTNASAASSVENTTPSRPRRIVANYSIATPSPFKPKTPSKRRTIGSANASPSQRASALKAAAAATASVAANSTLGLTESSGSSSLLQPTSSDAYFASHTSSKARRLRDTTSNEVISATLGPLSAHSLSALPARAETKLLAFPSQHYAPLYGRWLGLSSLAPLLFHGLGDMRGALEAFLRTMASEGEGSGAVVRGDRISRIDELLCVCEEALEMPAKLGSLEARTSGIVQTAKTRAKAKGVLFVLIHDVGSALFLTSRAQALLKRLARAERIQLLATVSHVRAANLASTTSGTGPAWIWETLCTLVPRDDISTAQTAKLAGLPRALHLGLTQTRSAAPGSRNALAGFGSRAGAGGPANDAQGLPDLDAAREDLTSQSAVHIYKSATAKAQLLFRKFAAFQLAQAQAQACTTPGEEAGGGATRGMKFDHLRTMARNNLIATNDDILRFVLSEFTSHGLLRRVQPSSSSSAGAAHAGASESQAATQSIGANAQSQGLGSFGADVWVRLALSDTELQKAEELCRSAFAAQQQQQ